MRPNELEEVAGFADALKGEFETLVDNLELSRRDKYVRDILRGFDVLCRRINSMARKSV